MTGITGKKDKICMTGMKGRTGKKDKTGHERQEGQKRVNAKDAAAKRGKRKIFKGGRLINGCQGN